MTFSEIVTFISVIVAIVALIIELRLSRLALYTQVILELDKEFYSGWVSQRRQEAAKKILNGQVADREIEDILDFFADIGILLERGALDKDLVYDVYSYWILYYWRLGQDVIKRNRMTDPESWLVVERMVKHLEKESKLDYSPRAIDSFVLEEAKKEKSG